MKYLKTAVLLLSTSMLACASPAGGYYRTASDAVDESASQVYTQLAVMGITLAESGFSRLLSTDGGALEVKDMQSFELHVVAGRRYAVYGACDIDCADMDIGIFRDPGGHVIAHDLERDPTPIVIFWAERTETLRVTVLMSRCHAHWCGFGIQVRSAQVGGKGRIRS